ncbi:MAG: DUF58 domain-containing protein [Chthonomonas sp.]|nr:DUF58 domain-containing protein [Chthonomonas sp.]
MRNTASLTLILASFFLAVVAVLVNSPALFYMGTALIGTIVAAKFQARYAVRNLKLSRTAPAMSVIGEPITVSLAIESENRFTRPLLLIEDQLPNRMVRDWIRHPVPVAPSYQQPVQIKYQIKPLRRGIFKWSDVSVMGTDALGLSSAELVHSAGQTELKVLPAPIPFELDMTMLHGAGYEDSASVRSPANSLDARGVREFSTGDQVRHIHWPSTARSNRLMVRDFESQAGSRATVLVQRTPGSDIGEGHSSLDQMCGHAAFLIEQLLPRCSHVSLNVQPEFHSPSNPLLPYLNSLAELRANGPSLASELAHALQDPDGAGRVFIFLAVGEAELLEAIRLAPVNSIHAFVYDAKAFQPTFRGQSAGGRDHIRTLEEAGVRVQVLESGVLK